MSRLLYLHALTPVHSGTGHAVSVIDLPISREKATGWPQIPGSSLKGVLRDHLTAALTHEPEEQRQRLVDGIFGAPEKAGSLAIGDQRLLCLAVRSFFGTFAYVTSPLVLTRFLRDCQASGATAPFAPVPSPATEGGHIGVALGSGSVLKGEREMVYLEDLDLQARQSPEAINAANVLAAQIFDDAAEQKAFVERFAVVPDDTYSFLCETATEVTARIRLKDDTKTVADGGLWYEESVPTESIFVGPLATIRELSESMDTELNRLHGTMLQIGGDASVGRGMCRVALRGGCS